MYGSKKIGTKKKEKGMGIATTPGGVALAGVAFWMIDHGFVGLNIIKH